MKTVHPQTAYEKWTDIKVQKIYKRDIYKPWTFSQPRYAVTVKLNCPDYDLCGWIFVWLGMTNEPTTYGTEEEAMQFMRWIKDWCDTEDKVEDVK